MFFSTAVLLGCSTSPECAPIARTGTTEADVRAAYTAREIDTGVVYWGGTGRRRLYFALDDGTQVWFELDRDGAVETAGGPEAKTRWVHSAGDSITVEGLDSAADETKPQESAMRGPFRLARGVTVADLTGVHEGYSTSLAPAGHTVFTVNVSAERLESVFRRLAAEIPDPGFLLLEIGTHESVEKALRKSPSDPFHKDVYYLDSLTSEQLRSILDRHGELLVHDGGINFGYGAKSGVDEVFVGPYKVVNILSEVPEKYFPALDTLGLEREEQIRTVVSNFGPRTPGRRRVLTEVDVTIWDLIEELEKQGLYFAERRDNW